MARIEEGMGFKDRSGTMQACANENLVPWDVAGLGVRCRNACYTPATPTHQAIQGLYQRIYP